MEILYKKAAKIKDELAILNIGIKEMRTFYSKYKKIITVLFDYTPDNYIEEEKLVEMLSNKLELKKHDIKLTI